MLLKYRRQRIHITASRVPLQRQSRVVLRVPSAFEDTVPGPIPETEAPRLYYLHALLSFKQLCGLLQCSLSLSFPHSHFQGGKELVLHQQSSIFIANECQRADVQLHWHMHNSELHVLRIILFSEKHPQILTYMLYTL